MNSKERILAVMNGQKPDRIPFVPLINDYFLSALPDDYPDKTEISFQKSRGIDVLQRWTPTFIGLGTKEYNDINSSKIQKKVVGDADKFQIEYKTPYGTLTSIREKAKSAGDTLFITKPLICAPEDIRAYQYIWESSEIASDYSNTQRTIDAVGDDGVALGMVPPTPMLQLIMYDLGVENVNYMLMDHPDKFNQLIKLMNKLSIEACKISADSPIEIGIIPENSGTLLVSPNQFKKYCFDMLAEYAKIFHSRKKQILLHACGHLKGLLKQIKATGLDGIESLSSPPTGNVELEYALEVLGEKMTIIGGIDPVEFVNLSGDILERNIKKTLDIMKDHNRFMLMPSDSTVANTPLDNFDKVMEILNKY